VEGCRENSEVMSVSHSSRRDRMVEVRSGWRSEKEGGVCVEDGVEDEEEGQEEEEEEGQEEEEEEEGQEEEEEEEGAAADKDDAEDEDDEDEAAEAADDAADTTRGGWDHWELGGRGGLPGTDDWWEPVGGSGRARGTGWAGFGATPLRTALRSRSRGDTSASPCSSACRWCIQMDHAYIVSYSALRKDGASMSTMPCWFKKNFRRLSKFRYRLALGCWWSAAVAVASVAVGEESR
jgi:hypothetical protein